MLAQILMLAFGAILVLAGLALLLALGDPMAALLPVLLGAALLVVGSTLGRRSGPAPASPRPAPVPPVGAEDVSGVPEPVTACPQCGFLGVRPLHLGEGGIPGVAELSDKRQCPRCGYQGLAVTFPRRDDYRAFLADLARQG